MSSSYSDSHGIKDTKTNFNTVEHYLGSEIWVTKQITFFKRAKVQVIDQKI